MIEMADPRPTAPQRPGPDPAPTTGPLSGPTPDEVSHREPRAQRH